MDGARAACRCSAPAGSRSAGEVDGLLNVLTAAEVVALLRIEPVEPTALRTRSWWCHGEDRSLR